jgi:hypothetical protein
MMDVLVQLYFNTPHYVQLLYDTNIKYELVIVYFNKLMLPVFKLLYHIKLLYIELMLPVFKL